MRPVSSRWPISPCMWAACSSMIRSSWRVSARGRCGALRSAVAAEPMIDVSGARSSWLTMPTNSARSRPCSSRGARSCRVTTTDSTAPSSARIGVAFTSVVTRLPPGALKTISSARRVVALPSSSARGSSSSEISLPLENR